VQKLAPDIIGFSEVWANSSKDRFISGLKSQLPYYAWDQNKKRSQLGSGLLLLSRFPLSNASFIPYANLASWDKLSQKGFILATVEVGAQKFLIAHTHTQAEDSSNAVKARKANINQLYSTFCEVDDSIPIILLGDLNITGENKSGTPTEEYKFLRNILRSNQMSDLYRTLNPSTTLAPGYTYDGVNNKLIDRFAPSDAQNAVKQRLDYMFVRGITPTSVTVLKTFTFQTSDGTMDISDHYPLDGHFLLPE
jgi:endonuclease/exonuclease/phosphatase family metal-dependent hydrolase